MNIWGSQDGNGGNNNTGITFNNLLQLDGQGSGLDADTVDGIHANELQLKIECQLTDGTTFVLGANNGN